MDQEKITKSIKENRGILRQLTSLFKEVRQLKSRVRKLEKKGNKYLSTIERMAIPIEIMSEKEIANIKVGGTDPD